MIYRVAYIVNLVVYHKTIKKDSLGEVIKSIREKEPFAVIVWIKQGGSQIY